MEEDEEKPNGSADYYRGIKVTNMDEVFALSEELNRMLLDSREYRQYVNAMHALQKQPDLYRSMTEYRKRNRQMQMYTPQETIFEENNNLVAEFEPVLKNDAVENFLAAEQRFCRMMQTVYALLGRDLEFDDEYMKG